MEHWPRSVCAFLNLRAVYGELVEVVGDGSEVERGGD